MKRVLLLLVLFCSFAVSFAQPIINRTLGTNTVSDPRWMARLNLFTPRYADTTAANLQKGIDSCAALIYTYDVDGFWYRQCFPKKWVRFSVAGSGVQSVTGTAVNITDPLNPVIHLQRFGLEDNSSAADRSISMNQHIFNVNGAKTVNLGSFDISAGGVASTLNLVANNTGIVQQDNAYVLTYNFVPAQNRQGDYYVPLSVNGAVADATGDISIPSGAGLLHVVAGTKLSQVNDSTIKLADSVWSNIYTRLSEKLNLSDSAAMLSAYRIKINLHTDSITSIHSQIVGLSTTVSANTSDIATNATNVALKLNKTDTAAMLTNYKTKIELHTDSIASIHNQVVGLSGTVATNTTNTSLKLNITDTAAMILPYRTKINLHTDSINSIHSQIVGLASTSATHTSDIATNTSSIGYKQKVYNVDSFGAIHNGVSDDRAAIQSAINAANAMGGGVVYFPNGVYNLGTGKDASSNSQLFMPINAYNRSDTGRVIKLLGETSPSMYSNPLSDTTNQRPPLTGVVLLSGLTSPASIIGSRSQTVSWGQFNFGQLQLENITVRSRSKNGATQIAPQDTAINGSRLAYLSILNVRVDTESPMDSTVQPATTSVGVIMPKLNNFVFTDLNRVLITGFYNGLVISEHSQGTEIMIDGCYNGIVGDGSNNHANNFDRIGVYRTKYNIRLTGVGYVNINQLSLEDKLTGSEWFVNIADLQEVTSTWQGHINFNRVVSNVGVNNTAFVRSSSASSGILVTDITQLNYFQSAGNDVGLTFSESSGKSVYGRVASVGGTIGVLATNDAYLYGSQNVDLWSDSSASAIRFLGGTTPVEHFNLNAGTGNINLNSPYAGNKFLSIKNTSTNTLAQAVYIATNGANSVTYGMTGTAFATYGVLPASSGYLYSGNANGLTIMADHASGAIKFTTGGNAEKARISSAGNFGIGDATPASLLTVGNGDLFQVNSSGAIAATTGITSTGSVTATQFKLSALNTAPSSSSDTGTTGEIRIVNGFIYICVATNTWQRAAITTF